MRFNGLGNEDQDSFAAALDKEEARTRGEDLPKSTPLPEALLYRRVARYSEQIKRYFAVFPRPQVHIILQEDMKKDTAGVYSETLAFLGVDTSFQPDFRKVNTHKVTRFESVRTLLRAIPKPLKDLVPKNQRNTISRSIRKWNSNHDKRKPLDKTLESQLRNSFSEEITLLSSLIGRDLQDWN